MRNTGMTLTANVSIAFSNKFYVKVKSGEIKGRGISEISSSVENTKNYLVTEKAYNKLASEFSIKFQNVVN
jgi:ribosomal protein L20A (L18A)